MCDKLPTTNPCPLQVLTAAHCVPGGVDHVEIGRHNILSGDSTTTESIPVSSIISHNCYDEYTMTSDIALLILASNSNFAPVEYLGKSGSAFFSDADSGLPTVGGDDAQVLLLVHVCFSLFLLLLVLLPKQLQAAREQEKYSQM